LQRLLLGLVAVVVVVVVVVMTPVAAAGGFATVQLSSVPSDGIEAGTRMAIDITVLQHGVTPLAGVTPVFQILDPSSGAIVREETGRPTSRPGVYRVDVSFPRQGTFDFQVVDGFGQTHTYAPFEIVAPVRSGRPRWSLVALAATSLLVASGAAAAWLGLRRRPALPAP
jgi:hypothetical protein